MNRYLNRKTFVTTLGAAGLGLSMTVGALGGVPGALAQDVDSTPAEELRERLRPGEMRAEFYTAFTAALGAELGSDAAAIDTGIRNALATVIDGLASDDLVTSGQATAMKSLVASLEAPVGPGPMMGMRGGMMRGHGPEGGPRAPGAPVAGEESAAPTDGPWAIQQRFYPDFTAALAAELGAGSADDVDAAIRLAMIAVIDGLDSEALPMPIPTDALKAMVATAESPLGPGLLFGPGPGMMIRAFHGHDENGHGFFGRGGEGGPFGDKDERGRAGDGDERGAEGSEGDDGTNTDDSASNDDDESRESA